MEMHEQPALVPDENNSVQDSSPVQETVNLELSVNEVVVEQEEEIIESIENNETEVVEIKNDETTVESKEETTEFRAVETFVEEGTQMPESETIKEEVQNEIIETEPAATNDLPEIQDVVSEELISHIDEDDENEVLNYHHLNQKELIEELIKLVSVENVLSVKNKIGEVRNAFIQLNKEEKKEIHQKYIADGGDEEKYVEEPTEAEVEFNNVFKIFKDKKAKLLADQEADKVTNLKLKQELLEKLRELINSESTLRETYNQVKELQEKWREIGHVPPEEHDNLWKNYHFLLEKFFDKVKINNELEILI